MKGWVSKLSSRIDPEIGIFLVCGLDIYWQSCSGLREKDWFKILIEVETFTCSAAKRTVCGSVEPKVVIVQTPDISFHL